MAKKIARNIIELQTSTLKISVDDFKKILLSVSISEMN